MKGLTVLQCFKTLLAQLLGNVHKCTWAKHVKDFTMLIYPCIIDLLHSYIASEINNK